MMSGVAYAWSVMGMITILRGYLPPEFQNYVRHWLRQLVKFWKPDPYCRFYFHEVDARRHTNHLFRQVEMHLRAKHLIKDADDLFLSQDETAKKISYTLAGTLFEHALAQIPKSLPIVALLRLESQLIHCYLN